jgi:predicted dehydrogenase
VKIGVIGAGVMGQNHVRICSELKQVSEVLVHDVRPQAAEAAALRVGATVAGSLEAILDAADAVSICVPTPYHLETAERTAEAGVPMLIEKPICATVEEGERLLEELPRDLTVGVGQIERFNPIVEEIRKIVKEPLYVEMKRHNPASTRITGTSIVEDLMIHDIDILAHVLFPRTTYRVASAGDGDVCSALFRFDGCHAYLSASRKSSKKIRSIYIEEEERTIEGDFMAQEVYVHRKPGQYAASPDRYVQENIIEKVLVNRVEPLRVELAAFLAAAAGGPAFPVTPAEAVENLRIAAAVESGL